MAVRSSPPHVHFLLSDADTCHFSSSSWNHTQNIAFEVFAMTAFTALVMFYNGLVTGFTDTSGVTYDPAWSSPFLPPLTLPTAVFSLTSPSLGLLLGKFPPHTHTHKLPSRLL